jgi:hypothetical protein
MAASIDLYRQDAEWLIGAGSLCLRHLLGPLTTFKGEQMKKLSPRPSPAMIVACVALFVALGGTALAATYVVSSNSQVGPGTISGHHPPTGNHTNIIAGSVNNSDLADGSVHASKLAGGAVRAPALGTISVVRQEVSIAARTHGGVAARCPAGTRRIGGGANDSVGQTLTGSFPLTDGWAANGRNDQASGSVTLTAYALCLDG